jgi:hypothetical protein
MHSGSEHGVFHGGGEYKNVGAKVSGYRETRESESPNSDRRQAAGTDVQLNVSTTAQTLHRYCTWLMGKTRAKHGRFRFMGGVGISGGLCGGGLMNLKNLIG